MIKLYSNHWERIIVLLLCCSVVFWGGCNNSGQVAADQWENPLANAFAVSGAEFEKWYLAGWGILPTKEYTPVQLETIGKEICRALQIEVNGNTCQQVEDSTTLLFTGIKGGSQYEILLQKLPMETYLIVNIDSVIGAGELAKEQQQLRETLSLFVAEPDISAMMKGYLPEKYSDRKGQRILTKMIQEIDGIVVEKTVEKTYMSFTGYTEALEKSVLVGNQKINLQCSLSYDEGKEKTMVYLATPLIFAEY